MKVIEKFGLMGFVFAAVLVLGTLEVNAQQASMTWRGTVDDHVQIVIRGRNATVKTLSGTEYHDARYNFSGRAGRTGRRDSRDSRASVKKDDGRGKARVVQQPSRRNNYTTIIQIDDTKGGADRYRLLVTWN